MKEIDFLPEWYKTGKRREISYRTQCIALIGVFMVMMVWNFVTTQSISKAKAQLAQMRSKRAQAEALSMKLQDIKGELRDLKEKRETVEEIDSNINVANVLAELSFLIDEKTVLSRVEFVAERFKNDQQDQQSHGGTAVVRAVQATKEKRELPLGDVRFRIVMAGVAADAGDVAALICKLEDSPYFCQVVPSFSRNAVITTSVNRALSSGADTNSNTKSTDKDHNNVQVKVSEFEISCYLANYREH
jgi:cell division protein FtsB